MDSQIYNLIVLLGATAGGKTTLAVAAAKQLGGEIISADSRQVYRSMDLGTGKDLDEYGDVPYHLIDIAEPGSEYNVFRFQQDCYAALEQIWNRGRMPLICGGTGMYLDAALSDYCLIEVPENKELRAQLAELADEQIAQRLLRIKPQQHNRTDLDDRERMIRALEIAIGEQDQQPQPAPPIKPLIFGLQWPRETLRQRIGVRLKQRLQEGMIEEVEQLHRSGVPWNKLEFYGLEYRFIAQHLQGQLSRNDMEQKLRIAIGKFAKRQETFFRRMERNGVNIHWLDARGDAFAAMCHCLDGYQCELPGAKA